MLTEEGSVCLEPKSRQIHSWYDGDKSRRISIKTIKQSLEDEDSSPDIRRDSNEFEWSTCFKLEEIGSISVRSVSRKTHNIFKYFRIDRKVNNDTIFVTVRKENLVHPEYLIDNKTSNTRMKYRQ